MNEKFEYYDILGIIVPGVMLMCFGVLCFPETSKNLTISNYPEAFSVIALIAAALFLGNILQALVSLAEPLLDRSWGGRLSEQALKKGLGERYFPLDSAKRISTRLTAAIGDNPSLRSRFLFAMQLAETSGNPQVGRFNALYAYNRALLLLSVVSFALILASLRWGALSAWDLSSKIVAIITATLLTILLWRRTKQRGIYYVREVLYTAERLLNNPSSSQ
jgi:hypothetical protein